MTGSGTYAPATAPLASSSGLNGASLLLGLLLLLLPISVFFLSAPLAVLTAGVFAGAVATTFPPAAPLILIMLFFFQNTVIALFSPLVDSLVEFDVVRGMNFVVLSACYAVFILALWLSPHRPEAGLRRWLAACMLMLLIVLAFLAVGILAGEARDAFVYFRNILIPLACLHIGLVVGALYHPDIRNGLTVIVCGAMAFGYLEFLFGFDWLRVFNGDHYVRLQLQGAIDTGMYERELERTGRVLGRIEEEIKRPFLNVTGAGDFGWTITRIGGPNFHPISFGYGLVIVTAYLSIRRRHWPLIAAIPLVVLVGSKGALILLVNVLIALVAVRIFTPRMVLWGFLLSLVAYASATYAWGLRVADYHVIGLRAGIRDFVAQPLGHGLGQGGISAVDPAVLDWARYQAQGIADIPVESSVGVLLYQLGLGGLLYISLVAALARLGWGTFVRTGEGVIIISFVVPMVMLVNGLFQEEAYFAPLALGTTLLLFGMILGDKNFHHTVGTSTVRKT